MRLPLVLWLAGGASLTSSFFSSCSYTITTLKKHGKYSVWTFERQVISLAEFADNAFLRLTTTPLQIPSWAFLPFWFVLTSPCKSTYQPPISVFTSSRACTVTPSFPPGGKLKGTIFLYEMKRRKGLYSFGNSF